MKRSAEEIVNHKWGEVDNLYSVVSSALSISLALHAPCLTFSSFLLSGFLEKGLRLSPLFVTYPHALSRPIEFRRLERVVLWRDFSHPVTPYYWELAENV